MLRFARFLLLGSLLWSAAGARADEVVPVCYNWGCVAEAPVNLAERALVGMKFYLQQAGNAAEERQRLAYIVGRLYAEAARQTPIRNDRAGNWFDADANGRMDCIDHSTTTTRFLHLLEQRRMLRWHRVLEPARRRRFVLVQHFAAVIEELPATRNGTPAEEERSEREAPAAARFVVDSWFVNPGKPPVIMPLENWMEGEGPDADSNANE